MLHLMKLEVGQKVRTTGGSIGEITENIGDGVWVQLRWVDVSEEGREVGGEDLVHCEEIAALA